MTFFETDINKIMTLVQLEYIIALDNFRHFATAAEYCCVTQPTLSMQIQKLEEEFGVLLFDRKKQPVSPTLMGEEIIKQARIIVQESKKVKELIKNHSEEVIGEIRIGVIPTLAPYLLPLFVHRFVNKFPQLKVIIIEMKTEELMIQLKMNAIDIGLMATPTYDTELVEKPLFYEEFLVYVSENESVFNKEYVLSKDIDNDRLWLLEEGHCVRSQTMQICDLHKQQNVHKNLEYQVGNIETLRKMVDQNGGIALLPELVLKDLDEKQRNKVRHFQAPAPVREISLVIHRNFQRHKIIDALMNEISAVLPEKMLRKNHLNIVHIK